MSDSEKYIFIDTGTRPAIPDLPGLSDIPFLTSDTIQGLDAVPSRLLVLGAGYIGLDCSTDASVRQQGHHP
jgi:pyruvate/2-oxoglutarate dehydrogenase complex dihydrolipoamide dehydrogenase (E3) component